MLGTLADALTDRGLDMLLSRVDSEHLNDLAELYDTGRASGIVVIGQWGHHDQLNELAMRRVPFVVWGAQLPRQLYCSVGSDNFSGGRLATDHLLDLGRRHIAFLGDIAFPETEQRYQGYLAAHQARGLKPDPQLLVRTSFATEEVQAGLSLLLKKKRPLDGVFAASDLIAINTMGFLSSHGVDIPKQVSVVGYDDIEAASHCHPPLTTVRQSIELAGPELIDCLLQLRQGQTVEPRVLATTLQLRKSTCPL
jgi:DNA-binding LacI/PurR family transcriptional regulator